MTVSPVQATDQSAALTPLQQQVANKMATTVIEIAKDALTVLMDPQARSLSPSDFAERYVTQKQKSLSDLDDRTQKFFHKVMDAVYEQTRNMPFLIPLKQLGSIVQIENFDQKFLQVVALPHVQKLQREFDAMKSSIVDDIIGG